MGKVLPVTRKDFDTEVLKSEVPVLVDFFAPWCVHCKKLAPTLEALCDELSGKIKIYKVNVDEERSLAQQYSVLSLPTVILFVNGENINKMIGNMPKEKILEQLSLYIN